jgi:hypothetical protein
MLISLPCMMPGPLTLFSFLSDFLMRNRRLHYNFFFYRPIYRIEEHLGVESWAEQSSYFEEQEDSDSEDEEEELQPGLTDSDIDRHTEFFKFPNFKNGCCAIDQEAFTPGDSCRRIKQAAPRS